MISPKPNHPQAQLHTVTLGTRVSTYELEEGHKHPDHSQGFAHRGEAFCPASPLTAKEVSSENSPFFPLTPKSELASCRVACFFLKCTQGEGHKAKQIDPSDTSPKKGIYGMFYAILIRKNIK